MSSTPRTDAQEIAGIDLRVVYAEFARQLELELNESKSNLVLLSQYASHGPCCTQPIKGNACDCGLDEILCVLGQNK